MNKILLISFFLLNVLSIQTASLYGIVEEARTAVQEGIDRETSYPFTLQAYGDWINHSKIDKKYYNKDHVNFGEFLVETGGVFAYEPYYDEALFAFAGYRSTYLGWKHNPFFHKKNFNDLVLRLGYSTKRYCKWTLQTILTMNADVNNFQGMYFTYNLLAAARYNYRSGVGLWIGFLAETGMRSDRCYPVIGFDWQISSKMKLNLIYPTNIAFVYLINPHVSLAAAMRFFDSRHRADKSSPLPRAFWRYTNTGIEAMASYQKNQIAFSIHAGYTLGGTLKVANRYNHNSKHFRLNAAPYVGGNVAVKF